VHKAVPMWPAACKREGYKLEQIVDPKLMHKYYLSTVGVMRHFLSLWDEQPALKPRSIIVVGAPDHVARCVTTVKTATTTDRDLVFCAPMECYPMWHDYGCNSITGYDPSSTQRWTTSRINFLSSEFKTRLQSVFLGSVNAEHLP